MEQNTKLKIFISYSHQDNLSDNPYIEEFKKHITPLKDNGLIEEWYDHRILPSEDYQNKIDNNLEDADIICLFVSVNFLSSGSCKNEKKKAFELRKKKGVPIIPIILSPCGWNDDKTFPNFWLCPQTDYPSQNFPTEVKHGRMFTMN